MEKRKSPNSVIGILISCVVLTLFVSCSDDSDGTARTAGSSAELTFESLHPVNQDLKDALAAQKINIVDSDGKPEPTKHSLIIDGDWIATEDLNTDMKVLSYLKNRKGLLVLNATGAHREALAKVFGFFSGQDGVPHYYVHVIPGTEGRQVRIIHYPELVRPGFSMLKSDNNSELIIHSEAADQNHEAFAAVYRKSQAPWLFARDIRKYIDKDNEPVLGMAVGESFPGNLKHFIFYSNSRKTWFLNNYWWESWNHAIYYTKEAIYPAIAPMEGDQTGAYEYETKYTVYLNNDPDDSLSPYQWLAVDHLARLDPAAGPNSTYVEGQSIAMPMRGEEYETYPKGGSYSNVMTAQGFGWGQFKYVYSNQVVAGGESGKLAFYQANPVNTSSTTSYTSGHQFTIGFNAGLTKTGPSGGVSGSFTAVNTSTVSIPDWTVLNNSHPDTKLASWTWYSSNPSYKSDQEITRMNDINLNYHEVPASVVYRSNSLIDNQVTFQETYGVDTVRLGCYTKTYTIWFIHYKWYATHTFPVFTNQVTIDFGKVLYPIVWKLSVSPESVNGGTKTTGTITLDKPAPPGGTTVALSSNNTSWATVPATITIPAGQSAAIFNIDTYPVAGNATATLFAEANGSIVSGEVTVLQ